MYDKTRGLRNNNPGNIRHGDNWQGMAKVQNDASFITFVSPVYGIRAIAKIIGNYKAKYGLDTIAGIINRWAPPSENDTQAYIDDVSQSVGIGPDMPLQHSDMTALVSAIIKHENGVQPYSLATLSTGIAMSGVAYA